MTEIDALQAFSCVECGRCTEQCPAFNTGKVLNPEGDHSGCARLSATARDSPPTAPLVGTHISEEAVFQCTTCGGCEEVCPVGIQHLPFMIGLRRGAVNTGEWEDEYGTKLFLNMERNGNSLGFAASERQKFIEKNALPIFDGTQEYCLWLGCMGAYDPQGREIVLALVRSAAPPGDHLRRAEAREVQRRPGAPSGQRSPVSATGGREHRTRCKRRSL